MFIFFFLMIRRPPRSTQSRSSAASDVYKRQVFHHVQAHPLDPRLNHGQQSLAAIEHGSLFYPQKMNECKTCMFCMLHDSVNVFLIVFTTKEPSQVFDYLFA
eukprot:TRINITY_DN289_c0_g1_i1.p4 TRINITY_DN289_c0_g1~~TRINITY_DN289_c0_g1_i1.p4  ORF type:complete len:102 (+),score=22.70 TRINITY_DN289_c0_g1_i1:1-306(+)